MMVKRSVKFRYVLCTLALFLSLMLLGFSRADGERKPRSRRAVNVGICRNTCADMGRYLPPEQRSAWNQLVADAPELALRSSATALHELPRTR